MLIRFKPPGTVAGFQIHASACIAVGLTGVQVVSSPSAASQTEAGAQPALFLSVAAKNDHASDYGASLLICSSGSTRLSSWFQMFLSVDYGGISSRPVPHGRRPKAIDSPAGVLVFAEELGAAAGWSFTRWSVYIQTATLLRLGALCRSQTCFTAEFCRIFDVRWVFAKVLDEVLQLVLGAISASTFCELAALKSHHSLTIPFLCLLSPCFRGSTYPPVCWYSTCVFVCVGGHMCGVVWRLRNGHMELRISCYEENHPETKEEAVILPCLHPADRVHDIEFYPLHGPVSGLYLCFCATSVLACLFW
ncbi:hypothetical protein GOODEAATRI_016953 [Goodea atripinnis]|uniref:Uncharacterized protein n=1 Tax=Goodea atripinnis TaxID=208336 RepID=A0ABV0NNC8_9TELE